MLCNSSNLAPRLFFFFLCVRKPPGRGYNSTGYKLCNRFFFSFGLELHALTLAAHSYALL